MGNGIVDIVWVFAMVFLAILELGGCGVLMRTTFGMEFGGGG